MKKSLLLFVVVVICFSLIMVQVLYGSKKETAPEERKAAPAEKKVLRMWSWNNEGDYPEVFELTINRFEKDSR